MTLTTAEKEEWFARMDAEIGPQIEQIFEGDEDSVIRYSEERWDLMICYIRDHLRRKILFDPAKAGTEEYGEKHPLYKQFEMFVRGTHPVIEGEAPYLYNKQVIAAAFWLAFGPKSFEPIDRARGFFRVQIVPRPEEELVERDLKDIGALNGVPE